MKWSCRIGWHKWYYGRFMLPVYGRYERRCLECPKLQFVDYIGKKHHWVDFVYVPEKPL
jgi:hypothetical protein